MEIENLTTLLVRFIRVFRSLATADPNSLSPLRFSYRSFVVSKSEHAGTARGHYNLPKNEHWKRKLISTSRGSVFHHLQFVNWRCNFTNRWTCWKSTTKKENASGLWIFPNFLRSAILLTDKNGWNEPSSTLFPCLVGYVIVKNITFFEISSKPLVFVIFRIGGQPTELGMMVEREYWLLALSFVSYFLLVWVQKQCYCRKVRLLRQKWFWYTNKVPRL